MKKEYDFSEGVRGKYAKALKRDIQKGVKQADEGDVKPLDINKIKKQGRKK